MKNYCFILALISFIFSSCSNADDSNDNLDINDNELISFVLDGEEHTFDEITNTYFNPTEGFRTITVNNSNTNDYFVFNLYDGLTGESLLNVNFTTNDVSYFASRQTTNFYSNITTNTAENIIGTFSGVLFNPDLGESLSVSEGEINVTLTP